jgi:hypothetical protein
LDSRASNPSGLGAGVQVGCDLVVLNPKRKKKKIVVWSVHYWKIQKSFFQHDIKEKWMLYRQ